jgi:hypothetical protein
MLILRFSLDDRPRLQDCYFFGFWVANARGLAGQMSVRPFFLKSAYNSGNPSLPWKCQFFYPTAYAQVKSQLILNFRADFRSFWAAVNFF